MTLKKEIKKQKKILKELKNKRSSSKIDKRMRKIENLKIGKTMDFEFASKCKENTKDIDIVCFFRVKNTKNGYIFDNHLDYWDETPYFQKLFRVKNLSLAELRERIIEYIEEAYL